MTPSVKGDPSGRVRALLAELELLDAQRAQPLAVLRLANAQRVAAAAAKNVDALTTQLAFTQQATTQATQRLAQLAIAEYVDPRAGALTTGVVDGNLNGPGNQQVLLSVSIKHQRQVVRADRAAVAEAQRKVAAAQSRNKAAQASLHAAQRAQISSAPRLAAAQWNLAVSVAHEGDTGPRSWSLPIMGQSAFTGPQLSVWFTIRKQKSFARAPIDKIAGWYVSEGHDEGVRGDMAFIQAIIETGSFSNADTVRLNNFAGIGHCDNCGSGFDFTTPQLGVRGQIQLLKSYAQKRPDYKHPLVDPRLRGPAGCCNTWRSLTRSWATDPTYGPKLLELYRQALEWLVLVSNGTIPKGA